MTMPSDTEIRENERLKRVTLNAITEPGHLPTLRSVARLGPGMTIDAIAEGDDVDRMQRLEDTNPVQILERAREQGLRFVIPGDDEWPEKQLRALDTNTTHHEAGGYPMGLWFKGGQHTLRESVSIVGSRSATTYGGSVAGDIAAAVARQEWAVVSGGAFGIDQAAHRGALANGGITVAVLACGADRAYPSAHRNLLDHIGDVGLVISEAHPGSAPTRLRFLARNRIIAALGVGTVVVEAAVRSGALNTATWARSLERLVMGVPGPVTSAPSQGVHQLLRLGHARVVAGPEDVLEDLHKARKF